MSNSLFIAHSHALWSWQTFEFEPIRSHYQVHLVDNWLHVGWTFYLLLHHRADESQPALNSYPLLHLWLSVWSLSCRCRTFLRFLLLRSVESNNSWTWVHRACQRWLNSLIGCIAPFPTFTIVNQENFTSLFYYFFCSYEKWRVVGGQTTCSTNKMLSLT